jgi:hypothetical protein
MIVFTEFAPQLPSVRLTYRHRESNPAAASPHPSPAFAEPAQPRMHFNRPCLFLDFADN